MPKLLGFLRSKSKVEDAAWAVAQVRTAARLGLFVGDGAPSDGTSPDAAGDGDQATADGSSSEVEPGPWTGGPRPPIVVVGISGVASVLPKIGVARRGDATGDPRAALPIAAHLFPPRPVARPGTPAEPLPAGRQWTAERSPAPRAAAVPAAPERSEQVRAVADGTKAHAAPRTASRPAHVPAAYCPYCAKLLDPAPTTSRRCDRCRQRIVLKRIDRRVVYLTEAAVQVFEAERRRAMEAARWTRDRDRWLGFASEAGAPAGRVAQLAAALPSEQVVAGARTLYLTTVERAFRTGRGRRDWDEAARLRRQEAALLYRVAGSPMPPPSDVVAIYQEGLAAELRGIAEISRNAELVSTRCCAACRGDDRVVVRIAQELRAPRLPHAGCPKGLCPCHWDLAAQDRMTISRYLQRRPGPEAGVAVGPGDQTTAFD